MLLHPRAARGLADGGAHCGVICDASMPTFMLTHWTRDRTRGETLPLEWVVKKQTHDTARLYGLGDRGTHRARHARRPQRHRLRPPAARQPVRRRRPARRRTRLLQGAEGYVATIKSGVVTFSDGEDTGARPGRLLRGARDATAPVSQPLARPVRPEGPVRHGSEALDDPARRVG